MNDLKKPHTPKDTHYAKLRRAYRDQKAGGPVESARALPSRRASPIRRGWSGSTAFIRCGRRSTIRAGKSRRMLVTRNALERLKIADLAALLFPSEIVEPKAIDSITGGEAVHQGVVIEAEPLKPKRLDALGDARLVVVLDQVTDPHNVGAIMRSAVAFGAGALITTSRHSPHESGVLAKSASGALEHIDLIEVRNLAEALAELHGAGFQTVGLDSEGAAELETSFSGEKIALVLGAEGKGLRQRTRETVTSLARLEMPGAIRSLNVSNAAAIALYAAKRFLTKN